jgi:CheY-like chemotaxis protein
MKSKPSVLFIDDDATTRRIYTSALTLAGLPIHIVSSAEEAAKVLEEKKVDVIVTDLMMPGFNGVDLIKAVREADYTRRIPVIVFTSGGNLELIEQAIMAGANEVVQKLSCPPPKLVEAILRHHAEATKPAG